MPEITKKESPTPSRPPGKARRVKKEGPILQVKNLRKVYEVEDDRVVALGKVSLSIQRGEICCILGTSGSGKSTLLNIMAGLEKPTNLPVLQPDAPGHGAGKRRDAPHL